MLRRIGQVAGWAMVIIGLVHMISPQFIYGSLEEPGLWFASGFTSGGLAFICLGLLNVAYLRWSTGERGFRWMVTLANAGALVFLIALAVELTGDIPALLALVAVAVTSATTPFANGDRIGYMG